MRVKLFESPHTSAVGHRCHGFLIVKHLLCIGQPSCLWLLKMYLCLWVKAGLHRVKVAVVTITSICVHKCVSLVKPAPYLARLEYHSESLYISCQHGRSACVRVSPFAGQWRGGVDRSRPGPPGNLDRVDLRSFCRRLDSAQSNDQQTLCRDKEERTHDKKSFSLLQHRVQTCNKHIQA